MTEEMTQDEKNDSEATRLTPDQMYQFFIDGAVGTKEFRSWLAFYDPLFRRVRDPQVDDMIDEKARRMIEWQEFSANNNRDQLQMIDREGNITDLTD